MAADVEFQRHKDNWNGFVRFLQISTGLTVALLVLLAWFLL